MQGEPQRSTIRQVGYSTAEVTQSGQNARAPQQAGAAGEQVLLAIQDIGMPTVLCSGDGRLLVVNTHAAAVLGTRATLGEALHTLAADEGEASTLRAAWLQQTAQGAGWSHECRLMGRDQEVRNLHLIAIPVQSAWVGSQAWLVVLRDVTEALIHARELEIYAQELSQLYQTNQERLRLLQEAEQARDHFYSMVSHEMKTPLTSLRAALEMLGTPELIPPGARDAWRLIKNMERSMFRLQRVINDLLDVATAKSGRLSLTFSAVDMAALVEQVVEETAPLAKQRGISLETPRRQRGLVVRGDEVRLQQVVQNLLSNAIKAAPSRAVVRVDLRQDERYAYVSIANPGEIDASIRSSLFQPFTKSSSGGYKAGAGLGLAVVDALVQGHGGRVAVASGQREVVFSFTIPLWEKESRA